MNTLVPKAAFLALAYLALPAALISLDTNLGFWVRFDALQTCDFVRPVRIYHRLVRSLKFFSGFGVSALTFWGMGFWVSGLTFCDLRFGSDFEQ